jgi:hypothetical protein
MKRILLAARRQVRSVLVPRLAANLGLMFCKHCLLHGSSRVPRADEVTRRVWGLWP